MRFVGLDLGEKTIGVAVSDALLFSAQPVTVIKRRGDLNTDLGLLKEAIEPYKPYEVVIGLPKNMDGTEGPSAKHAREFASFLEQEGMKVHFWDERLSTMAVEKVMIEADLSRKKRRKVIDQQAASFILQGFLDRLRSTKEF